MKVTITVKEVNPDFDHDLADRKHGGDETADNILYNWEDEFVISGDVTDFKVRNNMAYELKVQGEEGESVTYEIPSMMLVDCHLSNGEMTTCAFSRSLVKDSKKVVSGKGDIHFYVFLKGKRTCVNPVPGIYIDGRDFPEQLPLPDEEE